MMKKLESGAVISKQVKWLDEIYTSWLGKYFYGTSAAWFFFFFFFFRAKDFNHEQLVSYKFG